MAIYTLTPSKRDAGFTLLEVMAALAIVALLVSMALPGRGAETSTAALRGLSFRMVALLDADRYTARRTGRTIVATFDPQVRRVHSGASGASIEWPADVTIKARGMNPCTQESRNIAIVFYPDGYACGDTIRLEVAQHFVDILVNQFTGGVTIGE
jgi:type II secretion system protein H